MMAFVRSYRESDFEACAHICQATLPLSLSSSPVATKLSPYLWTHPYTFLSPSTCWVLDDGAGNAVGYCIGCPDIFALGKSYQSYVDTVLSPAVTAPSNLTVREPWTIVDGSLLGLSSPDNPSTSTQKVNVVAMAQTAYNIDWLIFEGNEHLTDEWRSTMHIDLLDHWQGQGWGRKLIEAFVESVKRSGQDFGQGIWIGIAGENGKVVKFYEKLGFRIAEKPGKGESEGIQMVRDIS